MRSGRWASAAGLLAYTVGRVLMAPLIGAQEVFNGLSGRHRLRVVVPSWLPPSFDPPASGTHVVFVGPTIGEFRMMEVLAAGLKSRHPHVVTSFCLKDKDSIEIAQRTVPDSGFTYRPVDFWPISALWVSRVRPDVLVFVEGWRFPTLAWTNALCGGRNAAVNVRFRPRKKVHHRLFGRYFRWIFRPMDAFVVQTEADVRNGEPWVVEDALLIAAGDLKAAVSAPALTSDPSLEAWIGSGPPVLAAGSTVDTEEEDLVVEAFLKVRESVPCRILIAPRAVRRADEIAHRLREKGLTVSRRTVESSGADVLLLDTLGELASAYAFGEAAYVGGFFTGSGHNLLEPVGWGKPVAYGPRRGAFESVQSLCEAQGVGVRVESAEGLAEFWRRALTDTSYRAGVKERSASVLTAGTATLDLTLDTIERLLRR